MMILMEFIVGKATLLVIFGKSTFLNPTCYIKPPKITMFIGAINHFHMDGLWHCFTHMKAHCY